MELANKYKTLLSNNGVNTPLRLAHFFAQIDHESGLKPISENLNYSSIGLQTTFKKYFPDKQSAESYQRKPINIANKVYANRMGNGSEQSGDGWRYRGRGFIQITGKENYIKLSKKTGIDFVSNPDLLLEESNAMISALWFWNNNYLLNTWADKDDILTITKKINGGTNGLEHRKSLLLKYKKMFTA
jgi:putative chitinase